MNGNFRNSDRFRPQVIRSVGGFGLALLLAACASTTVPIASPLGSSGPTSGKAAQRSALGGAGGSSATGAAGAAANGGGAANEFNAAAGNDGSPANGFDIRRADGKGGSNGDGDARGDVMGADDSNGMSGAGGNGSRRGGASTGNGAGNGDVGAGGGAGGGAGAGANGLADGSDTGRAAGRRKGSAGGDAAGANPAGGQNGTSGTQGAGGKGADAGAGSAGGAGAAGGRSGTNAADSNAAGGNGAGGKGGADDDLARIAMARDGSAAGGNGDGAGERRGRVETGHGGVDIDRDERSVTLGGALPTTLGMGEGQFEFDRFSLSDDVKAKLDTITEKLGSEPYDKLYVTGYSDRIGDADYNKKLSEKRAWAVAGYLMDKGIPPEKLKVEGKGEANSLVAGGECMALKRAELIQCLERDRRVELLATIKEYNLKVK